MVVEDGALKAFVASYVRAVGGAIESHAPGVYRVELSAEASAELEGTPWLLWGTAPAEGRAHVVYYFTFDPAVHKRQRSGDIAVELIRPGSRRLEQMISALRKGAPAFRAWLSVDACAGRLYPAPRRFAYRPFHVFLLRIDYTWGNHARATYVTAVDRIDHVALPGLAERLPRLPLEGGQPPINGNVPVEHATLALDAAFAVAFEELLLHLEEEGPPLADTVRTGVLTEQARLEGFFAERAREGDDIEAERLRRLEETELLMPQARVECVCIGDLALPVAFDADGCVHHLSFQLF